MDPSGTGQALWLYESPACSTTSFSRSSATVRQAGTADVDSISSRHDCAVKAHTSVMSVMVVEGSAWQAGQHGQVQVPTASNDPLCNTHTSVCTHAVRTCALTRHSPMRRSRRRRAGDASPRPPTRPNPCRPFLPLCPRGHSSSNPTSLPSPPPAHLEHRLEILCPQRTAVQGNTAVAMQYNQCSTINHNAVQSATPRPPLAPTTHLVHRLELLSLLWHLLEDVGAREDGLQVLPRGLAGQPVVQHVLQGGAGQRRGQNKTHSKH